MIEGHPHDGTPRTAAPRAPSSTRATGCAAHAADREGISSIVAAPDPGDDPRRRVAHVAGEAMDLAAREIRLRALVAPAARLLQVLRMERGARIGGGQHVVCAVTTRAIGRERGAQAPRQTVIARLVRRHARPCDAELLTEPHSSYTRAARRGPPGRITAS